MWREVLTSPAVLAVLSIIVAWAVVTLVRSPIEHGRRSQTDRTTTSGSPPRA